MAEYVKAKQMSLKNHAKYNEKWIQQIIAEDPSVLGLGNLVLRDQERPQPRAGRLDLLLRDPDTSRRYEAELQLGATDESHIIRTIEYWDIERKRYPQYDHCALIIAEDITARFLNVIALFNGFIPLVALQLQALEVGDKLTIVFTKVLDEMTLGLVDEDEDAVVAPTDRSYWERKASKKSVELADQILEIARKFDDSLDLKYNKIYIGIVKDGQPYNFIVMKPRRNHIVLEVKITESEQADAIIEEADFDTLDYDARWKCYRLRVSRNDIEKNREAISTLIEWAYRRRASD